MMSRDVERLTDVEVNSVEVDRYQNINQLRGLIGVHVKVALTGSQYGINKMLTNPLGAVRLEGSSMHVIFRSCWAICW